MRTTILTGLPFVLGFVVVCLGCWHKCDASNNASDTGARATDLLGERPRVVSRSLCRLPW